MTDTLIGLSDELRWREALCGIPHGIAHTWEYWYAMHLTTGLDMFLYSFSDGDARFVCPFAERRYRGTTDIVSQPGLAGFAGSGRSSCLIERWNAMAAGRGYVCGFIGLHPVLADPAWFRGWPMCVYSAAYGLDLTLPMDEIHGRISENRKRDLQRADREGVHVWVGTPPVKEFFIRHFDEAFQRRRFGSAHYLSDSSRSFLSSVDNFLLVGAGRDQVEAVTGFGFTPHAADGLYNVSFSSRTSFSTLLIWGAIRELKARGVPFLNLGGGIQPDDGIARYKQFLGTTARPLACLKQVFDPATFARLCRSANLNSSAADGGAFFPPYHAAEGKHGLGTEGRT